MTKISSLLFALVILGLGVSLFLYNKSKKDSERFIERVNTVNKVLLLLERTEKLKNILRKTAYEESNQRDPDYVFNDAHKNQLDSSLEVLHKIVLYDDQRLRIDTIRDLINSNYQILMDSTLKRDGMRYYKGTSAVISRAQHYAETRLKQQMSAFIMHENRVSLWLRAILLLSVALFAVGAFSTVHENILKRNLKSLHESILINASIGISVFEVEKRSNDELNFNLIFSNYGAVVIRHDHDAEVVISLATLPFNNPEIMERVKIVLATGKNVTKEIHHEIDGNLYWFLINLSRVSLRTVAFYYQDITRIKSYEKELKHKVVELESVNKDLEQFAHATSHDLREPFRKIQVMADMINNNLHKENHARYLDAIVRASLKGSQLVEQILNYSKVQFDKSEQEPVDLNRVVAQVVDDFDLLMLEKNASITFSNLPTVVGNRVQMIQLFSNLISNAFKFSFKERNPVVDISCKEISGNGVDGLNPYQNYFLIIVHDNGIGFDKNYEQKIFNAFERLHNYADFPGFGLGLSLCKKIVMNHGGTIHATSVPGDGSEFMVYLPVKDINASFLNEKPV
jgi:signal transduction histidine kinase